MPLGDEITLERGHQRGLTSPHLRNRYFTTIGSHSVKTVADRHRRAAYHNTADELSSGTNIDDLERP